MFSGCYSDKQSSIPDKPTNSIYVQDNAKILDNDTKDKINQIGDQLYDKYKDQTLKIDFFQNPGIFLHTSATIVSKFIFYQTDGFPAGRAPTTRGR